MEEVGREHDSSVVAVAVEDFTPAKVRLIQLVLVSPLFLGNLLVMIDVGICPKCNHLLYAFILGIILRFCNLQWIKLE
jgi:hypothetical protein